MKIILCDESYVKKVAELYDEVTLYLENHVNYPKWKYKQYPALNSVINAVKNGTQYACCDGESLVGAFVLNDDPQGNYDVGNWSRKLSRSEVLIVHSFAILPRLQQKGVGGRILERIIELAKNKGAKALRLDIVPTNTPAKRLYEKHGFKYVGEYDLNRGSNDIPAFCLYELNLLQTTKPLA